MTYETRHTLASLGIKLTLIGWALYMFYQYATTGIFHPEWLLPFLLTIFLSLAIRN